MNPFLKEAEKTNCQEKEKQIITTSPLNRVSHGRMKSASKNGMEMCLVVQKRER